MTKSSGSVEKFREPVLPKNLVYFSIAGVLALSAHWTFNTQSPVFFTTEELIRYHGYTAESHVVRTGDGVNLTIQRVPQSRSRSRAEGHLTGNHTVRGPPVLLQHGFTASSSIWVYRGAQRDLAFLLADKGFDVWLLNSRGNSYTSLPENVTEFSFHEQGTIDLASSIDYILDVTGHRKVSIVGHSLGTTVTFALLSVRPDYNHKINMLVALAPLTSRKTAQEPSHLFYESMYNYVGRNSMRFLDRIGFWYKTKLRDYVIHLAISPLPKSVTRLLYDLSFRPFFGSETTCSFEIPPEIIFSHNPDGTLETNFYHLHENFKKDELLMRDYGAEENMLIYNSLTPPPYNLSQITVPISGYNGNEDTLTPTKAFTKSISSFGGEVRLQQLKGFNHYDLIWAEEASTRLYPRIVSELCWVNRPLSYC